jgi:hypothetical protein
MNVGVLIPLMKFGIMAMLQYWQDLRQVEWAEVNKGREWQICNRALPKVAKNTAKNVA